MFYSKYTDLNVHPIQNALTETSRITSDHVSGHNDPVKLTHRINHHGGEHPYKG